jgi:hypothetical protein
LNIPETPPIMNDGHYLTKGHAVLCVLYMKTNLMSRNILGPEGTVLKRRQPLAGRRIARFDGCIRMDHILHRLRFPAAGVIPA